MLRIFPCRPVSPAWALSEQGHAAADPQHKRPRHQKNSFCLPSLSLSCFVRRLPRCLSARGFFDLWPRPRDSSRPGACFFRADDIFASKVFYRFGIPTLPVFLAVGMVMGLDGPGGIYFDDADLAREIARVGLLFVLHGNGFLAVYITGLIIGV